MCSFSLSPFLPNQNCLRRRDAGLLNQLQELDKQISDLRLDVEKTSEEHLETDSRPSSGFYELSDGASGSLSNSSNSVFSECLSSCHSSTCFCSPLEATLTISDSCPKSADVNPKYQCDLVSKNGNDVYRYPSPLHAVAVQSPMFLLCLTGSPLREEERLGNPTNDICVGSELDAVKTEASLPSPSRVWPAPHPASSKKMDGYILSLVQKKTHPVRTNKPRTSVNADPTKGLLRNGSVCVRVTGGVSQGNPGNLKNSKQAPLPTSGVPSLDPGTFSPPKQWSKESKAEQLESKRVPLPEGCSPGAAPELQSKHPPKNAKLASQSTPRGPATVTGEAPKESSHIPDLVPYASPYAYVASDSEYSAECESLFHSTVVDTSEDEQSNYTTNCFGDSESSVSEGEFAGESTSTSDSEESGGLIWSQFVQTLPIQAVTAPDLHSNPTKTFVKIKASHNLKKKILRFRSGSLKLMTTV
ncbi:PREDICTED: dapper homolog 1 [Myotis davidii]|uniref:dapper homolog 1 n=1 Tax=Myotis davidii TaxID=225400 RepID=UPI0007676B93|nr:PREDICTED: dapper homolog 1 [Myotis davidii]